MLLLAGVVPGRKLRYTRSGSITAWEAAAAMAVHAACSSSLDLEDGQPGAVHVAATAVPFCGCGVSLQAACQACASYSP